MPFIDLPPKLHERVICSIAAAVKYEVPANIVLAVAEKEGGKPGQWVKNTNGTHDVGPMQFNTLYLSDLAKYGITANDVAAAGCYSFDLAAWRLRQHIRKDKGDLWTRVANYHSRSPQYNAVYRADLMHRAVKWADWLDLRFVTRDVAKRDANPSTQATVHAVASTTQMASKLAPPVVLQTAHTAPAGPWSTASYVTRKLIINGQ